MSFQSWIFVSNAIGCAFVAFAWSSKDLINTAIKMAFAALTLLNLFELLTTLGYLVKAVGK